jgi:hypothetical protein
MKKNYIKLIISICLIAYPVIGLFLSLPTNDEDFSQQSFGLKQIIYVCLLIIGIGLFIVNLKKIINTKQ